MAAREEILARLRASLADRPRPEPVRREYRRGLDGSADPVALFAERVADYQATVHRTTGAGLAATLAEVLGAGPDVVVPPDTPAGWLSGYRGAVRVDGEPGPVDLSTLDATASVLTGCAVAVAETGTIVLDAGARQGRRALTLVPDHHVCVVDAGQVVGTVVEAVARLDPRRPLTWISGPSATSDIELKRVEGVHGPRRLDVVVVVPGGAAPPT